MSKWKWFLVALVFGNCKVGNIRGKDKLVLPEFYLSGQKFALTSLSWILFCFREERIESLLRMVYFYRLSQSWVLSSIKHHDFLQFDIWAYFAFVDTKKSLSHVWNLNLLNYWLPCDVLTAYYLLLVIYPVNNFVGIWQNV